MTQQSHLPSKRRTGFKFLTPRNLSSFMSISPRGTCSSIMRLSFLPLGMAITTVVTIAEILKNNGLATEKKVLTSTVGMKDEHKGRQIQKAKIEIVLGKSEKFDSLMNAASSASEGRKPKIIRMMKNSEANLMFSCCSSVSTFLFSICLIVVGTYFFIKYFVMDSLGVERQWHNGTLLLNICLSLL
ncbi:hypothetical protein OIU84_017866 [Salix udensis]|uniref:Alba DNA/RNA-binding protein n=1 Tax=Salix udensis TaxID=889485 RepID=A0AAD6PLG7_9ROSI|nr:hypothetical protein OIU84_017866 [Salix udensis]